MKSRKNRDSARHRITKRGGVMMEYVVLGVLVAASVIVAVVAVGPKIQALFRYFAK